MHPLKKHILEKLIFSDYLTFSKLKPKDIEGNIFMYHLKQLIQEGTVEKTNSRYQLTTQGQSYADTLNFKTLKYTQRPKALILLVYQNQRGEYLLYKRRGQPLINLVGFPFFEVKPGISIYQRFDEKLMEYFNLKATIKHLGDAYISTFSKGELLSYIFCHVFTLESVEGVFGFNEDFWDIHWSKLDKINPKQLIPGVLDIEKLIKQNKDKRFFAELTYTI